MTLGPFNHPGFVPPTLGCGAVPKVPFGAEGDGGPRDCQRAMTVAVLVLVIVPVRHVARGVGIIYLDMVTPGR